MSAIKYWLWLSGRTDVSPRARAALAAYYGSAQEAYFAPPGDFAHVPGLTAHEAALLEEKDLAQAERMLEECIRRDIELISYQDAQYPSRLKNIFAPPVLLFVKGSLKGIDERAAIAVIGTRKASAYGTKMGKSLAYQIGSGGGAVISMLTEGIDTAAAQGALLAGANTIAVLGGPIPQRLSPLQEDIAAMGALVSEYGPGIKPQRSFFRDRNRIASGLSVGVVVVEAPTKSGALLFAAEALEQGREVFALPGNADAENSQGSNGLLKEGAVPVTCGWDVLRCFEGIYPGIRQADRPLPKTAKKDREEETKSPEPCPGEKKEIDKEKGKGYIDLLDRLEGLSGDQLAIARAIVQGSTHIDDIIEATGIPAAKLLSQLTLMEIRGRLCRGPGGAIGLK